MDYSDDMGGIQLHNVVLFTRIATTKSTRSSTEHRLVQKAQKHEACNEEEDGDHITLEKGIFKVKASRG